MVDKKIWSEFFFSTVFFLQINNLLIKCPKLKFSELGAFFIYKKDKCNECNCSFNDCALLQKMQILRFLITGPLPILILNICNGLNICLLLWSHSVLASRHRQLAQKNCWPSYHACTSEKRPNSARTAMGC